MSNTPSYLTTTKKINNYGINKVIETKENTDIAQQKIKYAKKRNRAKKVAKNMMKNSKQAKITRKNIIKTSEKTNKGAIKTAELTGKNVNSVKNKKKVSEKIGMTAFQIAKNTTNNIRMELKRTISAVRAIIAGTKALIVALIAGSWIALVIIVLITLVALLFSSFLGIFFSNEKGVGDIVMSSIVSQINADFANSITEIQRNNEYDDFEINSKHAEWKDIL